MHQNVSRTLENFSHILFFIKITIQVSGQNGPIAMKINSESMTTTTQHTFVYDEGNAEVENVPSGSDGGAQNSENVAAEKENTDERQENVEE